MKRCFRMIAAFAAVALAQLPSTAMACSACMGDPNSRSAGAINGAIYIMLGFVSLILGSVGAFAFTLYRRSQTPLPPHVELAEAVSAQENHQ
jgi:ABC-type transport system involved in multi-copper enzyme maturation permease subunit